MLRKIIKKEKTAASATRKDPAALEIAEMNEIAERLFRRLEARIKTVGEMEKRIDEKASHLERLIERAENLGTLQPDPEGARCGEIRALVQKGLKIDEIAKILGVPKGEIELILSIGR